jgi:hypothetical protein
LKKFGTAASEAVQIRSLALGFLDLLLQR